MMITKLKPRMLKRKAMLRYKVKREGSGGQNSKYKKNGHQKYSLVLFFILE